MPGTIRELNVTYRCEACGLDFTVYRWVSAVSSPVMVDETEEHEDCPKG